MINLQSDLTIVVRECDERTAAACISLLRGLFPGNHIHRVSARPFSTTLRLSLEKGFTEKRTWTLCIDADVLILSNILELIHEASETSENTFEVQGLVFDKLFTSPRAAGNHLYRTSLIEKALPLIPTAESLRPETSMITAMARLGFPSLQSRQIVGLHDFEQSYRDIYSKAYLHGHKHRFLLPLYRPLWQMLSREDDDYRVALLALETSLQETAPPNVSRDDRIVEANLAAQMLGLQEKPELLTLPDESDLKRWATTPSIWGEAKTLGRRIASLIERGTFPETGNLKLNSRTISPECSKPSIALVCGNAYPQFDICSQMVGGGGMETRAALFGRELAATGRWLVKFVVSDFNQPFTTRLEGIDFHIYQTNFRRAGRNVFPRLRKRRWFPALNLDRRDLDLVWQIPYISVHLALPGLFFPRFWRSLNVDVVCCFGNNALSAEVIADCRHLGKKTILFVASDEDVSPDYQPGNCTLNHYNMPKWKGHYALTTADRILVQTETQQKALQQHFGLPSFVIRNPVHISLDDPKRWLPRRSREFVLWIGRADDFNKRPMIFLELAKSCPELNFLMVANRTNDAVFHALKAACPRNLQILEQLTALDIWEYLTRARVFVNTSNFEGFPNTFLQCAVMGVPIVSLEVDPDGFLNHHGCGISAGGNLEKLRQTVRQLWEYHEQADTLAMVCHHYVLEQHEAGGRISELETSIKELISTDSKPGRLRWWSRPLRYAKRPI